MTILITYFGNIVTAVSRKLCVLWDSRGVVYPADMTDATQIGWRIAPAQKEAEPVRLPAPQPLAAPVFIYDCVTPLGGETLLSLLMKRMMQEADGDGPQ